MLPEVPWGEGRSSTCAKGGNCSWPGCRRSGSSEPQQTHMGGWRGDQHCCDQKLPALGLQSLLSLWGGKAGTRCHKASPEQRDKPMAGPGKEAEVATINAPSVLSISLRLIGASPCLSGQLLQEAPELVSDSAGPGSGSEGQRKVVTVGVRAPLIQEAAQA